MKPNQVLDDLLVKDVADGLNRQRLVKSKFRVTAESHLGKLSRSTDPFGG
jgi:hypothetical protein